MIDIVNMRNIVRLQVVVRSPTEWDQAIFIAARDPEQFQ